MIRACLRALISHWRHHPVQIFAFLAGLALATALWSGVQAINAEARASYDAAAEVLGEGQFDQLLPRASGLIPLEDYVALRRAGWRVSPVIEGRLEGVRLIGMEPLSAPNGLGAAALIEGQGETEVEERVPRLFARADVAAALKGQANIVIDSGMAPGAAVGDIADVARLLGRNDLNRLIILPEQPLRQAALAEVAPNLQRFAASQSADIGQLTDSFHLNLTAFGLLSFVVGLFIVHSTVGLAFEQRRGMLRTLRALGVPLRLLVAMIAVEMLALAFLAACLGIFLGYLIAAALLPDVAAALRGLYGARVSGVLELRTEWWLSGLVLALMGASVALFGRIWQVARMPILDAARPQAWRAQHTRRLRLQTATAALLLALAALLALSVSGLITGFALLGCLLLGAALALPVGVDRVIRFFARHTKRPVWQWFWADTRQQVPGLSLALMALLLAIAANVGVATMVSSFRLTFLGFLEQRLAPELYVQTESADQSAALQTYLAEQGIEVLPLSATEALIAAQPARVLGIRVGPTYRENWVFLDQTPDVWDRVDAGEGVILNEQFARRAGIWLDAEVTLSPGLSLPVVAVVADYGNPKAQLTLSERVFAQLYPGRFPYQFGLRTNDPTAMRDAIARDVGVSPNAMINQAQLKAASLEVFERTFLVTGALNVLTLGVAAFAILMSLLTLANMRIPQLAPVWAMGLTRRRLGWLELFRALVLAFIVFIFALPVGLVLAWVLLSVVNTAAFGWKLPLFLFPRDYAALGGYALLAAVLAASWPVLNLMRTPPARLLKVFSNER